MELKPQKPPIKRGKSGCWGCKERRKRCTEEKPSCKACSKKQVKCEYGIRLLWEDEAEKAGIAFGRAGMRDRFSKDKKVVIPHFLLPIPRRKVLFLNTTSGDVNRLYRDGRLSTSCAPCFEKQQFSYGELCSAGALPTIPPRLRQYPNLDQDCRFLLDYLIGKDMNVVCNRRVLLDGNQNPFRMIVLPLCLSSQALLHVVIAASANDLRNGIDAEKSKRYETTVLFHKSKSLSLLCKLLSTYTATTGAGNIECSNTSRAERDSMLLTVMMLCYLEIATGSLREWITHLNGATSLLNHYHNHNDRTSSDLFSSETIEFVHNYLSLRDTFSATTLDEDSYFKNKHLHPSSDCGDPTRINIYIGLSPELLDIISSITLLARSKYRKRRRQKENSSLDEKNSDQEAAVVLHERLDNLRQWSEEKNPNHLIYLNSAAFKEATYIYLRHGAYEDPTDHSSIQEKHLPKLLKLLHQIHAKQGKLLGSLPYPMWALFIAACVVSESDRVAVLGFFTDLNQSRPISNVPPTMSAVKAVWKLNDLDEGCERKSNKSGGALRLGFEWEEALNRLGWKMALT